jgi:hypothetical protein
VFILPTPPPAITQQGFTLELLVDLFIEQHSHIVAMALTHTDPHFTVRKLLLLSPGSIIQVGNILTFSLKFKSLGPGPAPRSERAAALLQARASRRSSPEPC